MVDIEFIKSVKTQTDERKIAAGDYLNRETIELLRSLTLAQLNSVFAPPVKDGKYYFEFLCADCHKILVDLISKTDVIYYCTRHKRGINRGFVDCTYRRCPECEERLRQKEECERKKQEEFLATKHGQTVFFETHYLIQGFARSDEYKNMLEVYRAADEHDIALNITDMPYYEFLKTRMWKILSAHIKEKYGNACAVCSSKVKLATHHRSYEHHGYELLFQDDLICLCEDCHSKFHDKKRSE